MTTSRKSSEMYARNNRPAHSLRTSIVPSPSTLDGRTEISQCGIISSLSSLSVSGTKSAISCNFVRSVTPIRDYPVVLLLATIKPCDQAILNSVPSHRPAVLAQFFESSFNILASCATGKSERALITWRVPHGVLRRFVVWLVRFKKFIFSTPRRTIFTLWNKQFFVVQYAGALAPLIRMRTGRKHRTGMSGQSWSIFILAAIDGLSFPHAGPAPHHAALAFLMSEDQVPRSTRHHVHSVAGPHDFATSCADLIPVGDDLRQGTFRLWRRSSHRITLLYQFRIFPA